jgi:hypothetical protein
MDVPRMSVQATAPNASKTGQNRAQLYNNKNIQRWKCQQCRQVMMRHQEKQFREKCSPGQSGLFIDRTVKHNQTAFAAGPNSDRPSIVSYLP